MEEINIKIPIKGKVNGEKRWVFIKESTPDSISRITTNSLAVNKSISIFPGLIIIFGFISLLT